MLPGLGGTLAAPSVTRLGTRWPEDYWWVTRLQKNCLRLQILEAGEGSLVPSAGPPLIPTGLGNSRAMDQGCPGRSPRMGGGTGEPGPRPTLEGPRAPPLPASPAASPHLSRVSCTTKMSPRQPCTSVTPGARGQGTSQGPVVQQAWSPQVPDADPPFPSNAAVGASLVTEGKGGTAGQSPESRGLAEGSNGLPGGQFLSQIDVLESLG